MTTWYIVACLDSVSQELDTEALESQIMAVWSKSLHDLPDMAELRNAFK